VAPQHVSIIDSAESTAQAVAKLLRRTPLIDPSEPERRRLPRLRFFATDSVEKFRCLGTRFLGYSTEDVQHVDLKE